MRLIVFILLLLFASTGICQISQQVTVSFKDKIDTEIQALKKEGINHCLILERCCDGCEIKNTNGCNCKNDGIISAVIYFDKNGRAYKREIKCCEASITKNIPSIFFDSTGLMSRKIKSLEREQAVKFYPPVATDQLYYKVVQEIPGTNIDFTLYDDQLIEGSEENKAWLALPAFVARKEMLLYLLKVKEALPANTFANDSIAFRHFKMLNTSYSTNKMMAADDSFATKKYTLVNDKGDSLFLFQRLPFSMTAGEAKIYEMGLTETFIHLRVDSIYTIIFTTDEYSSLKNREYLKHRKIDFSLKDKDGTTRSTFDTAYKLIIHKVVQEKTRYEQISVDSVVMNYLRSQKNIPRPTLEIVKKSKRKSIRSTNFYAEP
jgi:hypothetical protein